MSYEQDPSRSPEDFLDEVLLWRPPLPVDRADFSGLFEVDTDPDNLEDVPGYAWERLPRWITEIDNTFMRNPDQPIICFDLCSSIPLNAQMLRGLEFGRSGRRARELVKALFTEDAVKEIEDPELLKVHHAATQDKDSRLLLEAAVQTVLYTLNSFDVADGDPALASERLGARFLEVLPNQSTQYMMEDGGRNIETRWGICFTSNERGTTYLESLAELRRPTARAQRVGETLSERIKATTRQVTDEYKAELEQLAGVDGPAQPQDGEVGMSKNTLRKFRREIVSRVHELSREYTVQADEKEPVGIETAQRYFDWQVAKIVSWVAGNKRYRPARFVSLDMSSRAQIANSSLIASPEETRATNLFSHAVASLFDPHEHIPRDMFEPLPVPDNSLTFITVYDAWPFGSSFNNPDGGDNLDWESGPMSDEEIELCIYVAVDRLYGFYKKLAYGGKLVIFPWATFDNDERSAAVLRRVGAKLSLMVGHSVDRPLFHYATLQDLMSESELNTTSALSGIFSDEEDYAVEALIVEKPDRGLVEQHAKAIGRRLAIASRIRD